MGPKKDSKKEPVVEPPKQQEPVIPPHELQGYGRFQYVNGTFYEGQWRLCKGIKSKHGQGILTIAGTTTGLGAQKYDGAWEEDRMHGYGVYTYASGSVYRGEWQNNKHNGKGLYEFANGTQYEGEWKDHELHGTGCYIDSSGRKWQGQFRNGKFESKKQKELMKEKEIEVKKQAIAEEITKTIQNMLDAIAKSDKKTLKENFSPFFPGEPAKQFVKDLSSKFDERPAEKWTQFLNVLKSGKSTILATPEQSTFLGAQKVLGNQFEGPGQIVEVIGKKDDKSFQAAFLNVESSTWVVVLAKE